MDAVRHETQRTDEGGAGRNCESVNNSVVAGTIAAGISFHLMVRSSVSSHIGPSFSVRVLTRFPCLPCCLALWAGIRASSAVFCVFGEGARLPCPGGGAWAPLAAFGWLPPRFSMAPTFLPGRCRSASVVHALCCSSCMHVTAGAVPASDRLQGCCGPGIFVCGDYTPGGVQSLS